MPDGAELSTAKKIHALLLDAHPQRDSPELAEALKLASSQTGEYLSAAERAETISAIEALNRAVHDRASASDSEHLLLLATRAALHWVRSSS